MRQLSRRVARSDQVPRHSVNSEATMLPSELDRQSAQIDGDRARSFSGSSALLLNRQGGSERGFDGGSSYGMGHSRGSGSVPYTPTTPVMCTFPHVPIQGQYSAGIESPNGGLIGLKHAETADPYYRPPRQRRATLDGFSGVPRYGSGDWTKGKSTTNPDGEEHDPVGGPSVSGGATPIPAYLGSHRDDSDYDGEIRNPRTDYAVREVDFYYRPALPNSGTRKLKTGPADPTGPVSSATEWFRGLFGGKSKEKGKGFEVVRSARAPPQGPMHPGEGDTFLEPYRDDPLTITSDDRGRGGFSNRRRGQSASDHEQNNGPTNRGLKLPPLPNIGVGEAIELPSRVGSKSNSYAPTAIRIRPPTIPRKSSRRQSVIESLEHGPENNSTQPPEIVLSSSGYDSAEARTPDPPLQYLQMASSHPSRLPFGSKSSSIRSDNVSTVSTTSSANNVIDDENPKRHQQHRTRQNSAFGSFGSGTRNDLPSNMGYVQQHRASDSIHGPSPEEPTFGGTAAEVIGAPSR